MTHERKPETDHGIEGEAMVRLFDRFQRSFRDKGILATQRIIRSGLDHGHVLEIGPGPGYLGLEWLKATQNTTLTGGEISRDMIGMAQKNAREYGLEERVSYVEANALSLPFEDGTFDGVFSNSSMHEWSEPARVLAEIHRVLKPGGCFFISDLKRDISWPVKWFMYFLCKPKEIRPGMLTSIAAAYTRDEAETLFAGSSLSGAFVGVSPFGLDIQGRKHVI